jgi:hypothetical protein
MSAMINEQSRRILQRDERTGSTQRGGNAASDADEGGLILQAACKRGLQ